MTDPEDVRIVRRQDAMDLPTETDQDFMWLLFGRGERALEEISVKRPKAWKGSSSTFSTWWMGVRMKSGGWSGGSRRATPVSESVLAAVIAIGAAGYGAWTAIWGSAARSAGGSSRSPRSLVAALRMIPPGSGSRTARVKRLEAFRRLRDFSDLPNAPALAVVIWEHYLEWAVALGVADEVEKQVRALVPVESLRSPMRGAPGPRRDHRLRPSTRPRPASCSRRWRAPAAGPRAAGWLLGAPPAASRAARILRGGGGGGGGTGGGAGAMCTNAGCG